MLITVVSWLVCFHVNVLLYSIKDLIGFNGFALQVKIFNLASQIAIEIFPFILLKTYRSLGIVWTKKRKEKKTLEIDNSPLHLAFFVLYLLSYPFSWCKYFSKCLPRFKPFSVFFFYCTMSFLQRNWDKNGLSYIYDNGYFKFS